MLRILLAANCHNGQSSETEKRPYASKYAEPASPKKRRKQSTPERKECNSLPPFPKTFFGREINGIRHQVGGCVSVNLTAFLALVVEHFRQVALELERLPCVFADEFCEVASRASRSRADYRPIRILHDGCGSPKCHPPRVASILFSFKREL